LFGSTGLGSFEILSYPDRARPVLSNASGPWEALSGNRFRRIIGVRNSHPSRARHCSAAEVPDSADRSQAPGIRTRPDV
jgi:hypothetical protein